IRVSRGFSIGLYGSYAVKGSSIQTSFHFKIVSSFFAYRIPLKAVSFPFITSREAFQFDRQWRASGMDKESGEAAYREGKRPVSTIGGSRYRTIGNQSHLTDIIKT